MANQPLTPLSPVTPGTSGKDLPKCSVQEWMGGIEGEHIPRSDLNQIVLDYLICAGHKDAAVKFSREASIPMPVEPSTMDDRVKVLDTAHEGKMAECMKLLQECNPELLEQNPEIYLTMMKQMLIELIRERKISDALQFAQDVLAEKGVENPALLEDFERALALLAFDKPEESPYGDLLDLSRREEVKAQLNEAMLSFVGRNAESRLSTLCKMLLWSQDELKKRNVKFPKVSDLTTAKIGEDSTESSSDIPM
ncbi:glucose-induced degradation protein 8 homolog [Paramacrobiotus metropolitanus]|uniref:glucose-induced degradation protein 8 homolog n=1 Tax=Paramacrobiotus metropolitanus TaxID=2943436 RepID=UPI0024461636|nr:glucose-induced degradation protein 8 homolog [Paramacrobiotus metropolitanus]